MKRRERTSYAFLMEMMWVCAFFLVCSCIFVMAFAKAEQMSRKADATNRAVQAASNALEDIYTAFGSATAVSDEENDWNAAVSDAANASAAAYSTADFTLQITVSLSNRLLTVTVTAADTRDGEELCSLTGARAASAEAYTVRNVRLPRTLASANRRLSAYAPSGSQGPDLCVSSVPQSPAAAFTGTASAPERFRGAERRPV